ncbi:uncharacterized protein [Montipora capricornis]|uniref:uncharacterized protein n=1 Tax=Montipora capricornis TaxID=246305 RepID=UPI0035F15DA1
MFSKKSPACVLTVLALTGAALCLVIVTIFYAVGMFNTGPELPDIMEGEASFTSNEGEKQVYRVMIDYNKKVVQFSSLDKLASFDEKRNSGNYTDSLTAKIAVHNYREGRSYFLFPRNGKSMKRCIYTDLYGEMIPQHLLKNAPLQSKNDEGNTTHVHFQLNNDTAVEVYRQKESNGKIFRIQLNLPNATVDMFSMGKDVHIADLNNLNCTEHIEEKYTSVGIFSQSKIDYSNKTTLVDGHDSLPKHLRNTSRSRRGIGWRNGWLDWWYGNWCGAYQGGYQNNPKPVCKSVCKNTTSYINDACRKCLPPNDTLDEACMEHDRCINDLPKGPSWCQPIGNPCSCDRPFIKRVRNLTTTCLTSNCGSNALQINFAFKLLSCWYPGKFCYPVIVCRCPFCLCPKISMRCVDVKYCSFLGSAKV